MSFYIILYILENREKIVYRAWRFIDCLGENFYSIRFNWQSSIYSTLKSR